jgi:hypothetical protein
MGSGSAEVEREATATVPKHALERCRRHFRLARGANDRPGRPGKQYASTACPIVLINKAIVLAAVDSFASVQDNHHFYPASKAAPTTSTAAVAYLV